MPKAKTPPRPKHQLAPLSVKANQKPVKTGEVVKLLVDGDYPTRYNEASAIAKDAEQLMEELKPVMSPDAISELFLHNEQTPWEPIKSVSLQDDEHNVTRISFTAKYKEVDVIRAEALFRSLKLRAKEGEKAKAPDINDYLAYTMLGKWNSEAFLGEDGKFSKERYDRIMKALDAVSKELGIQNPLSTSQAVMPLPTFATRRWHDFDKAANVEIAQVIQNQVTFTPCPNAVTGKMVGEKDEEKK